MREKEFFKKGFTLLETLVVVSVFTLLVLVVFFSILNFYKTNSYVTEQSFAVEGARKGIESTVRFIREATYSDEGAYPVINAQNNSFSFYSDVDTDNNIEKVRFFLDNDLFKRGIIKSAGDPLSYNNQPETISVMSDNVINISESTNIFEYYDSDGAQILDLDNITDVSFIKISLIVNVNPERLPNEFTLRSSATLRNLR